MSLEQLGLFISGILAAIVLSVIVVKLTSLQNRDNRERLFSWLRGLFRTELTSLDGLTISPDKNTSPLPKSKEEDPEIQMEFSIAKSGFKCPICAVEVVEDAEVTKCEKCQTPAHRDCFEFNGKCGVYACAEKNKNKPPEPPPTPNPPRSSRGDGDSLFSWRQIDY